MMSDHAKPTVTAYIAIGSNLGDRAAHHRAALEAIEALPSTCLENHSRLYESSAITLPGSPSQPSYLNSVVAVHTAIAPHGLLDALLGVESSLGRDRSSDLRWAPRTVDLDLLLYDDLVLDEPGLTLPHPRMHERLFVLEPFAEIAPGVEHPVLGKSIGQLLAALLAESDSVA